MLVRDTGIEPVTSSVSGKCSPAELIALGDFFGGGDGNRTRVHGFCRPLPHHSATPPLGQIFVTPIRADDGFEPATLTLAR